MFTLTTIDNPFDPNKEFEAWQSFDLIHGYNTCELLARFAKTSVELSDVEYEDEINNACDEIIGIFGNFYKKVEV